MHTLHPNRYRKGQRTLGVSEKWRGIVKMKKREHKVIKMAISQSKLNQIE